MTSYRRNFVPGGLYFFTLAIANRHSDLLLTHVDALKQAIHAEKAAASVCGRRSGHSAGSSARDLEPAAGRQRFLHALAINQEPLRESVTKGGAAQCCSNNSQ